MWIFHWDFYDNHLEGDESVMLIK